MADTSPYAPQILELSAQLRAMQDTPTEDMFTPEEIRKRKAKQLREEQLAVLAKLSGDKELGAVGSTLLPNALRAKDVRYTEHGEFDPLEGKHTIFPEYTRRIKEERLARQLQSMELKDQQLQGMAPYRQATADLQTTRQSLVEAQTDLARQKLLDAQRKSSDGKTLVGQVYKDVKKLGDDAQALDTVKRNFEKNFVASTSKGVSGLGSLQDTLAAAIPGLAPDQWVKNRSAWADLQRLKEMKARYELFGATLTGNELSSWQSVTPPRGGTQEDLVTWFGEQDRLIRSAIRKGADAAAAGGWNKKQIEEYTNGVWKAPSSGELTAEEQQELEALRARHPRGP